jgi:hypothetical protein
MEKIFFTKKNINILDPLSCIIYLGIIGFKTIGCKLSIKDSNISIQEAIVSQGISRWLNNDVRTDISELCNPIEKAIEWYKDKTEDIENIFKYSLQGLDNLIKCYTSENNQNTIIHSLIHYKTLINNFIKNKSNILEDNRTLNGKDDTLEKFQIFKNIWSINDIKCVSLLLNNVEINCSSNKEYNYYLNCIEELLSGKNIIKNNLIHDIINL